MILNDFDREKFRRLQFFRAAAAAVLIVALNNIAELGTPSVFLIAAAALGIALGGALLLKPTSFWKTALFHFVVFGCGALALRVMNFVSTAVSQSPSGDLSFFRFSDHITLLTLAYLCGYVTTWVYWTLPATLTIEAAAFAAGGICLLSAHRNYHLDAPKTVSALAWHFGLQPQHVVIGFGILMTALISVYLALSSDRPIIGTDLPVRDRGRFRRWILIAAPAIYLLLFGGYAAYINAKYSEQISRASNGVGQNNEEGQSPLGFHSAVGKTKQPALLVRLEGDYKENPWAPMLYLREGALSEFNGHEIVNASSRYDVDVPRVTPGQPYTSRITDPGPFRKQLVYSVYYLAQHRTPIAIDFPTALRAVRNPDPQRFQLAYRAVSFAPVVKLSEIIGEAVGDDRWEGDTWKHYLRAPGSLTAQDRVGDIPFDKPTPDSHKEDLRYAALAKSLVAGMETPVQKAAAISKYLSEQSIYTRQPGHGDAGDADPVAPYLFAEKKRGYCVHFAHAAVYLMRLAGIPARIGTGYLTDLTYAKDGHILLMMGDRHAWPEVYVRNYGWVVVDVQPTQAENEQTLVPDEKLLEELMTKLDPAEQFIAPVPPAPSRSEKSVSERILETIFQPAYAAAAVLLLVLSWLALKSWLWYSHLLPADPGRRMKRAYRSFACRNTDLGTPRSSGETRREYSAKLAGCGVDLQALTGLTEEFVYRGAQPDQGERLSQSLRTAATSLRLAFPSWRRFIAFLSAKSIYHLGRW